MRVHGGNPWALARALDRPVEQILDFSADLNPLGFPDVVRAVITESLAAIRHYPDPEALAFRRAVAEHHGVPLEQVWPGNGSAELIVTLTRLRPARRMVVVTPTFAEYAWAAAQAGAEVIAVPLAQDAGFPLVLDEAAWRRALAGAGLVFVCNPNNPTGTLIPLQTLRTLAAWCAAAGARLVVDEAFMEFVEPAAQASLLGEPRVVVLRSLTKLFAVPGLRLGYVVAAADVIEPLRAAQPPWPLNTFALAVGPALLAQSAFVARTRAFIREHRAALAQALRHVPGLTPLPSVANFVLCRLDHPVLTAAAVCERLAARGLLVRSGDGFTGLPPGRFLRIAVRAADEQALLVQALREVLRHAG